MNFDPACDDPQMLHLINFTERRKRWCQVRMRDTGELRTMSPYAARKVASKIYLLGSVERGRKVPYRWEE